MNEARKNISNSFGWPRPKGESSVSSVALLLSFHALDLGGCFIYQREVRRSGHNVDWTFSSENPTSKSTRRGTNNTNTNTNTNTTNNYLNYHHHHQKPVVFPQQHKPNDNLDLASHHNFAQSQGLNPPNALPPQPEGSQSHPPQPPPKPKHLEQNNPPPRPQSPPIIVPPQSERGGRGRGRGEGRGAPGRGGGRGRGRGGKGVQRLSQMEKEKERERLDNDEIFTLYESAIEIGMESAILKAGERGSVGDLVN
eukprot:CAMPEP_0201540400 /NCGR_PEP_ID=MMETSP0161_2-20130828/70924_1 /ASSEMBLY_ACC=CAM_ASM_000251 /TAXON_ID=180227 /ORGANISM="Neoparamoeba aestuarina, Strain SoJaBio B1-5/56/2" /LENGTH=252 /DNA_ID=CAMNT_0047947867 /DNA_START=681 /DNA_END=1435 /DNA_ORIENTATION=+